MTLAALIHIHHRFALHSPLTTHVPVPLPIKPYSFACPTQSPVPLRGRKEQRTGKHGEILTQVNTGRGWAEQRRAEKSASLEDGTGGTGAGGKPSVLIPYFTCDLCEVCIGPDYKEQELWLYPVRDEIVCFGCDSRRIIGSRWLHICGGCARWKKEHGRYLPDFYCMIRPEHWLTTILLTDPTKETAAYHTLHIIDQGNESQVFQIRCALDQQLLRMYRLHLFLLCIQYHIPIYAVFQSRSVSNAPHLVPRAKQATLPIIPITAYQQKEQHMRPIKQAR